MQINKIYNENCIDTMNRMRDEGVLADIILTSPPYNTSNFAIKGQSIYDEYDDNKSEQEYIDWTLDIFSHYNEILKPNGVILYNISYGNAHPNQLWNLLSTIISSSDFMIADCLIWKKPSAVPNNRNPNKMTRYTEFVFVICRKTEYNTFKANKTLVSPNKYTCYSNFIEARNNDGHNDLNLATFSTSFVEQLLDRYAYTNDMLVYDSFMGTGTTAVACKRRGLSFVGSELSMAQVEFANKWLAGERFAPTGVKKLF